MSGSQQLLACWIELTMQARNEVKSRTGQHFVEARQVGTTYLDASGIGDRHPIDGMTLSAEVQAQRRFLTC